MISIKKEIIKMMFDDILQKINKEISDAAQFFDDSSINFLRSYIEEIINNISIYCFASFLSLEDSLSILDNLYLWTQKIIMKIKDKYASKNKKIPAEEFIRFLVINYDFDDRYLQAQFSFLLEKTKTKSLELENIFDNEFVSKLQEINKELDLLIAEYNNGNLDVKNALSRLNYIRSHMQILNSQNTISLNKKNWK